MNAEQKVTSIIDRLNRIQADHEDAERADYVSIPASDDPDDLSLAEYQALDAALGDVPAATHAAVMGAAREVRVAARREAGEREARLRAGIEALAADGSRIGTSGRLLIWPDELRAVLDQGDEECA